METLKYKGIEIEIPRDVEPMNPRIEYEPFGTMVCFHPRYDLGDAHNYANEDEFWADINSSGKKTLVLSVYLYDHSGLTISTGPFGCRFDSGKVGYIYAEVGKEGITDIERIRTILKGEIVEYDQYLRGDVYGYTIETKDGFVDSCWGFYGDDHEKSGLLEHAHNAVDCYLAEKKKQSHFERIRINKELKQSFAFRRRKRALRTV